MPRARRDGTPADDPTKCKLTELFVRNLRPRPRPYLAWDSLQSGFAVQVQPSGSKAFKCIYRSGGRPRWYTIGSANAIGLADARKFAAKVMLQVLDGHDPCAERKALRGKDSFDEIASRYLEHYAKQRNRSWRQARKLVERYLLPRWAKLQAIAIGRED